MIDKIKKLVDALSTNETNKEAQPALSVEEQEQIIEELLGGGASKEPDLRLIGLFTEVMDEKVAELVHALLYLDAIS